MVRQNIVNAFYEVGNISRAKVVLEQIQYLCM